MHKLKQESMAEPTNASSSRHNVSNTRSGADQHQSRASKRLAEDTPQSSSGKRAPSTRDEGDQPQSLASKRTHRGSGQYLTEPHRRTSYEPKIGTKLKSVQVKVIPCTLDDNIKWKEWPHGKLSSLNVHSLFVRVARSYGIENDSSFVETKVYLADLVTEQTAIIHRGSDAELERTKAWIGKEAMAKHRHTKHDATFRVGLRPMVEIVGDATLVI